MRIRSATICGLAVLALIACERPASSRPAAAPAQPSAYDLDKWHTEAPAIAAAGGAVVRHDFELTLSAKGETVARFRSDDANAWTYAARFDGICEMDRSCTFYVFRYVVPGTDLKPASLVVNDRGRPVAWIGDNVLPGKGGWIASGEPFEDGHFEIDDLSQAHPVRYAFDAACVPDKWLSPDEVAVTCHNDAITSAVTHETVKKVSDHAWRMGAHGDRATTTALQPFRPEDLASLARIGFHH